jgi:hypothetical protein
LILVIIFSMTLLVLILFVVQPKKLHIFEILLIWCLFIFVYENFLAYFTLNAKLLTFSEKPQMVIAFIVMRLVLSPVILIWGIDISFTLDSWRKKGILFLVIVSVLVWLQYLAEWTDILKRESWKLWWSYAEWGFIFLMLVWVQKRFRIILVKEGRI